jgi:hypothetical protein
VENAYQLLRRWPFPDDITPTQGSEDTASLFDGLDHDGGLPVLSAVDDATVAKPIGEQAQRKYPTVR